MKYDRSLKCWPAAIGLVNGGTNKAVIINANEFEHIRRVNTSLGLFVPTIVTPVELFL